MYHDVTRKNPSDPPESEPTEPAAADQRKERVLHTRIPAVLELELKRFAENLKVPVSNVVRTILEDALSVADRATGRVEAELQAAARKATEQRESLRTRLKPRAALEDVFGYQPLVLAHAGRCASCGVTLPRGAQAWMGLRDTPGPRVFVCSACAPRPDGDGAPE